MFKKVLIITKSSVKKNILESPSSKRSTEYLQEMNNTNYKLGLQVAEKISKHFDVDVEPLEAIFDSNCREEYTWNQLYKSDVKVDDIDVRSSFKKEIAEQNLRSNESEDFKKRKTVDDYDFLISVGGDGTFLSCSHLINNSKKYLMGINSSIDSLGFLNNFKFPQFMDRTDEICERIKTGQFTTLKRKRFSCEFSALNSYCTPILGLNDVFIGTENFGSSLRYDFCVDSVCARNVKSTGVLLYTGTGSSAWANSLNHINEQKLAIIFEYFNEKPTPDGVEKIQNFINEKYYIASDSDFMGYLHRELFTIHNELRYEGIGRNFEIVNNTVNGFLAIDGFYYKLDIGAKISVKIEDDSKSLSCFKFDI